MSSEGVCEYLYIWYRHTLRHVTVLTELLLSQPCMLQI